jgi:hypothetical protein
VNGGINIQPLRRLDANSGSTPPLIVPELVDAQLRAVYELGFEQIRLTISFDRFGPDFLAAIPYARAARALGIDVLGVIGQFSGFDLAQAIRDSATRDEVLEAYVDIFGGTILPASPQIAAAGSFAAQIFNEPTLFLGITPEVYVRDFLRPAFYHLKEDDPTLTVVAAAAIGSAEGLLQARRMIETGLEHYCDRVAFHVYSMRFLRDVGGLTTQPVWVTESGVQGAQFHQEWMSSTFDRIRREIPGTERIYWFHLFDLGTDEFRLIDLRRTAEGPIEWVSASDAAVSWLRGRVAEALGETTPLLYRELIPDITLYFPTEDDFRALRSTSFGSGL